MCLGLCACAVVPCLQCKLKVDSGHSMVSTAGCALEKAEDFAVAPVNDACCIELAYANMNMGRV